MVLNREIELSRQRQNRQHEPRRQRVLCKIVRVDGNIEVPNRPGFIWVQDRDPDAVIPPFHAFNVKVQKTRNLEVWVELTQNGWEVTEEATGIARHLSGYTGDPRLPNHHKSHEWPDFAPQPDAINVYPRALTVLRCYPGEAGGLTVSVAPLRYRKNGALVLFAGAHNVDLSGSQPAVGQAIYVGVYLNTTTNAIATVAGAAAIDSPVVYPPSPVFPGGNCIPTALVRLDGSQTVFTEADFLDSRFWLDDADAPTDAQFLTLATDDALANERVFTPIAPLAGVDNGAGLTYDLSVGAASESASGAAELATQTETDTGADDLRIVTPLKLATRLAAALAALKPYQLWESDGGNVVVEVDAAGNIVVNESGADRDIRGESAINPNAFFFQGSNGALGLGTNAPVGVLHTVGDSINLQPTWNSYGYGSTPTVIGIRTNGTEASPTAVTDGDNIWLWTGYGYETTTPAARLAAEIRFEVDNPSGSDIPADIVFRTHDSGLSAGFTSEKMRLLSGGDLQVTGNVAAVDANLTGTASVGQRVETSLYEFPLILTGGEGSHFLDNDSSFPAGWTQADAASATDTNTLYSHWYLVGTSAETSWKYRIQTSTDLENDVAASAQCRFMFGPVIFKNAAYTADVDYYFGMYRNNAGAIDENTFCRVHLQWDQSAGIWQIQGQVKDSTSGTQHDGGWTAFSLPVNSRFWIVLGVTNAAAKTCLSYAGANYTPAGAGSLAAEFMNNLQVQNPTTALTWGTVWLQVHQTRGAGATDRLLIGAYDRLS